MKFDILIQFLLPLPGLLLDIYIYICNIYIYIIFIIYIYYNTYMCW